MVTVKKFYGVYSDQQTSEMALKKYGPREGQREKSLIELFENLRKKIKSDPLTITTDAQG